MKKITVVLLSIILISIIFLSCEKDEVVEKTNDNQNNIVQLRSGTADVIFYASSFTTDNYLNQQIDKRRIYKIFNKLKIKEVRFSATTKPYITVNGLLMRHYNVNVMFKDTTNHMFTAYTPNTQSSFVLLPYGSSILSNNHSAKFILIESIFPTQNNFIYNIWSDSYISPTMWSIKKNGVDLISNRTLDPLDKSSIVFRPLHSH